MAVTRLLAFALLLVVAIFFKLAFNFAVAVPVLFFKLAMIVFAILPVTTFILVRISYRSRRGKHKRKRKQVDKRPEVFHDVLSS
ncbi:MAG: hypothetical protein A3I66_02840 [Burkholderiales bacterium RIFCSPLOWO2_02_FULL_57_36]|nr:MAG: hypothetical protein A3I66_02840 [Burkholderiales bacterium RIFCSPLOWO2_02_FULL_57_36]